MTRTVMVSFLGRGTPGQNGYRVARYRFDDGESAETAFLGPALAARLGVDMLYVLGTSGSMWPVLVDAHGGDRLSDDLRLALMDASDRECVDQSMLEAFEQHVGSVLGRPCGLRLIPYARSVAEQVDLLRALASWLEPGDALVIDITHGMRHLPVLMLAAAHFLERIRGVTVQAIYYGALDMTRSGQETPVLNLTALLRLIDGVQALAEYDVSGDYGKLAGLLAGDGRLVERLSEAAYLERTTNPVLARQKLSGCDVALAGVQDDAMTELFLPALRQRLAWRTGEDRSLWEARLARTWLARRDYVRAVIYAQESLISGQCPRDRLNEFDARREAADTLRSERRVRLLFNIRNALAHGVLPISAEVIRALSSERVMGEVLVQLFDELLPRG